MLLLRVVMLRVVIGAISWATPKSVFSSEDSPIPFRLLFPFWQNSMWNDGPQIIGLLRK